MSGWYVGLMSGTSLDGIDAVLARIPSAGGITLQTWHYTPFDAPLQARLRRCCSAESVPLKTFGELDAHLGEQFGHSVLALLEKAGIPPRQVRAIGSHGQTLRHGPDGKPPYTLQIGDPNRIAEITGITTVADFRRRDMAAGGEGAPLVPAFHAAVFRSSCENRAVLNLGGIANLTLLPAEELPVTGFDIGPANTLMDQWIQRHLGRPFDADGAWARQGKPLPDLLETALKDPYFHRPPPKSTGPEYFSPAWLDARLRSLPTASPVDVQSTLAHLCVTSVATALRHVHPSPDRMLVCGGGVHNRYLLELLAGACGCPVDTTAACGISPDHVEALAFAWLAWRTLEGKTGNLPTVTGARRSVILGGIYPA